MSRWRAETVVVAPADVACAARSPELVLASFASALDAMRKPPGTRVVAVVGGDAVRLRVVPWNDALAAPRERQVLATQGFVEAYGEIARGWAVCEHATRFGEATLAAAIDSVVLDGLDALAVARGLRLAGVRPAFTQAFDARRRELGPGPAWFVWIERHVTTVLLYAERAPLHVRRFALPHGALVTVLARESFALGREEAPCNVFVDRAPAAADEMPREAFVANARFHVVQLPRATAAPGVPAAVAA